MFHFETTNNTLKYETVEYLWSFSILSSFALNLADEFENASEFPTSDTNMKL